VKKLPVVIVTVFTLLQLLVLVLFGYTPYPDSDGYIYLARQAISLGDIYPARQLLNDYPFLWNQGPVNAVILTLRLFGSVTPLLILYALMKGATAALLYSITKTTVNEKVALITLLLYVLYPANYAEATSTLSELPFIFGCMTALWLALNKQYCLLAGVVLAVTNWFRPMATVFLVALLIYWLAGWRKTKGLAERRKMLMTVIGYVMMIAVIGGASMSRTGLFLYQAKTGWMALMDYCSDHDPHSMAVRDRTDLNVSEKDAQWRSLFLQWLKDHPAEYVAQMPRKLVDTYVSDNVNMCTFVPGKNEREYMYDEVSITTLLHDFPRWSPVQWLTIVNLIFYYMLLLMAIGSLRYFKTESHLLSCSIIVLGTLLLLFVGHGEARFHIPFMPFFIIMAALFVSRQRDTIFSVGNETPFSSTPTSAE
jgi:hypothetical protein